MQRPYKIVHDTSTASSRKLADWLAKDGQLLRWRKRGNVSAPSPPTFYYRRGTLHSGDRSRSGSAQCAAAGTAPRCSAKHPQRRSQRGVSSFGNDIVRTRSTKAFAPVFNLFTIVA